MARKISAVTPFGTFERQTSTDYKFVALVEASENPEKGIQVYGTRKGDPELATSYTYEYTCNHLTGEKRTGRSWTYRSRYHAIWSRTWAGAINNAEHYGGRVLGVYPVSK